jgi:hypothetical protein
MFNPFYPFTQQVLDAFVNKGKKYFVRQTFNRGKGHFDEGIKGYFIFSHYDNLTTAQDHFGAISYDPNRFLYEWDNPEHQEKLKVAASGLKEYKVYANLFKPDWERGINDRIKEKVRSYVSKLGWSPKSGEMVATSYEVRFGELYMVLKYRGRTAKVKFDEVENVSLF